MQALEMRRNGILESVPKALQGNESKGSGSGWSALLPFPRFVFNHAKIPV